MFLPFAGEERARGAADGRALSTPDDRPEADTPSDLARACAVLPPSLCPRPVSGPGRRVAGGPGNVGPSATDRNPR
jgi:hypothetical protein